MRCSLEIFFGAVSFNLNEQVVYNKVKRNGIG